MASPVLPGSFARSTEDLRTWQSLAARVARAGGQARHHAAVMAFAWVLDGGPSPIGGQPNEPTLEAARVEHAGALILAELTRSPTLEEWEGLGNVRPPLVSRVSAEWGYGAWRVLAWLLARAADIPVDLWEGPGRIRPWTVLPPDARTAVGKAFAAAGLGAIDLDPRSTPRPIPSGLDVP